MTQNAEKPKGLTFEEAQAYVQGALREAKPEDMRARCIDGRYPEGSAAIAMPGGDAGLLAVGLAAARRLRAEGGTVSDKAVRDAVFETVGGKEKFNFHTDNHTMEKGGEVRFDGCGHCRLLKERLQDYQLDETQAEFFVQTLEEVNAEGVQPDVLEGSHAERAVMIVQTKNPNGKAYALDSQTRLGGATTQAFVYESSLAQQRFEALAANLAKATGAEQDRLMEYMSEIGQKQLALTAEVLAAHLPVYQVTVDGQTGEYSVEQAA